MAEKERTLDWYKDAVRNGLRFQIRYARSNMWRQYKAYYRHQFVDGTLPVNLVFSFLRATVPQVYFRNPAVVVTPIRPGLEYELKARLVEDIDNWLLRELSTKYQIKRMISDAFLCGTASGFIGYDSEYGYDATKTIGGAGTASLTQFDKKGDRIEYNSAVGPGMPWFLRARPEDVVYPWGCESSLSAEWVAMRVFRPLNDIKADRKYSKTDGLAGSHIQRRTTPEGGQPDVEHEGPKDHEWVELWQLRDKKTKEILVFTMDHNNFLRKGPDDMQLEGLPVEDLTFNPDPDYIYGIPDARIIEPQLLELNEIRTQSMYHRRIDVLKFLYKKGAIKPTELAKLLNEKVQAGVEVNADASLRDAVLPLNPGASAILADLERMGEVVRRDVREAVGFSRSSAGEYQGKTHVTKAETDVVAWANQIRLDERRDIVADLIQKIVRRFNQIIFTKWTSPIVRSIVGPDGAKYWLRFTPSEIKGEYPLKIDPTNALPVDARTKRTDAVEMAKAYAQMNAGQIAAGVPIPPEIQRYFFSQYEGINTDKLMAQIQQGGKMMAQMVAQQGGAGSSPSKPMNV